MHASLLYVYLAEFAVVSCHVDGTELVEKLCAVIEFWVIFIRVKVRYLPFIISRPVFFKAAKIKQ